jgi:hypothetical protein
MIKKGSTMTTSFGPMIHKMKQLSGTQIERSNPVRRYKAARTCEIEGCDARLSVYNPGPVCALHQLGY